MGGSKNIEPEDDRDIITINLNRGELMVALDQSLTKKQKNLRIHKMQYARKHTSILQYIIREPMLWRKFKKIIRKHIDGIQQELPLF